MQHNIVVSHPFYSAIVAVMLLALVFWAVSFAVPDKSEKDDLRVVARWFAVGIPALILMALGMLIGHFWTKGYVLLYAGLWLVGVKENVQ